MVTWLRLSIRCDFDPLQPLAWGAFVLIVRERGRHAGGANGLNELTESLVLSELRHAILTATRFEALLRGAR